eukprot:scaffold8952_cov15-Tisochrysis_lutea.AAC.1
MLEAFSHDIGLLAVSNGSSTGLSGCLGCFGSLKRKGAYESPCLVAKVFPAEGAKGQGHMKCFFWVLVPICLRSCQPPCIAAVVVCALQADAGRKAQIGNGLMLLV